MYRFCMYASMAFLVFGCSAARKISSVGLRELSSVSPVQSISERRLRLSEAKKFAKECPAEIVDLLPKLALEDVDFPGCPDSLTQNFHSALSLLKSEERTAIEEAINSQCRSLGSNADGTSIEAIFPASELKNLAARFPEGSAEGHTMAATRDGISFLIEHHLPLDHWVQQNGGYLLSEETIANLDKMVNLRKCKLSDDEVDASFHTIRGLEDLSRLLIEGEQRTQVQLLLKGIYTVQDRKIEEFFRP